MREEEGGRRDMERGIFDRAIDLGLGLGPGLDWGWRAAGEHLQCSPAADWRRQERERERFSWWPQRQPLLLRTSQPRAPDGSALWGRARYACVTGNCVLCPQKELEPSAGWRDGTLLPASLVVQLMGSV